MSPARIVYQRCKNCGYIGEWLRCHKCGGETEDADIAFKKQMGTPDGKQTMILAYNSEVGK